MFNFKKIFGLIILFLTFFNIDSYSEVIEEIVVKGNERISKETIMIFGDVAVGKNYEISDVNSLIKKLYDTTFFSNISVELKNNKLSIVVEENPLINSIIFDGEKAKKYTEKIRELLILKDKNSFIENNIKRDINQIKLFYRTLGYYFVKIDTQIEKLEKNRVNIVFAMTGTLAVYCSGYLLAFLRIEEQLNHLFYWPLRVILVFFCYQCLLIVVSIPFGQFKYFWFIQKKFLRRFGFKFN